MHQKPAQSSPHFVKYVECLGQLHRLIAEGRDDDEGDALRDEMDAPWRQMSSRELATVKGLSIDLYTIGQDRDVADWESSDGLIAAFQRAVEEEDWLSVLDLVREHEPKLPPFYIAFVRGICWARLKQIEIAIDFITEALRLNPQDDLSQKLLVELHLRAGRNDEALAAAEALAAPAMDRDYLLETTRAVCP